MKSLSIYKGKSIVITGAASGIGKEIVNILNKLNTRLYLVDIDKNGLETLKNDLKKTNENVHTFCFDVSDNELYGDFVKEFLTHESSPDYLFNNAGVGIGGEIINFDFNSWKKIIDVNLFGTINGIIYFYPMMIKQRKGHIINTSSVAGFVPLPGEASYVASKYAIQGLTEVLEIEATFYNVKVTAVCPGVVQTPIYDTGEVIGLDKKKILDLWPKGISASACAKIILEEVAQGKKMVLITPLAKALHTVKSYFPGLLREGFLYYFKKVKSKA
jgi:short-subunit dehydrogenase